MKITVYAGEYGGDGGNSAAEIEDYIKQVIAPLKAAGSSVIVFGLPCTGISSFISCLWF